MKKLLLLLMTLLSITTTTNAQMVQKSVKPVTCMYCDSTACWWRDASVKKIISLDLETFVPGDAELLVLMQGPTRLDSIIITKKSNVSYGSTYGLKVDNGGVVKYISLSPKLFKEKLIAEIKKITQIAARTDPPE
jgi:hypothetical protein